MKTKNTTVQMRLHPRLTDFLFSLAATYASWESELVITSGSEHTAKHSRTSLHYADPACAVDVRTWLTGSTPPPATQKEALASCARLYCLNSNIPTDSFDIVLESDHIHIEYQPKRPRNL